MKRGILATGLIVWALCAQALAPLASAAPVTPRPLEPHRPGVLLVGFVPGTPAAARADALRGVGAIASEQLSPLAVDDREVQLGAAMDVEQAIAALSRNPNVRYAEPDYIVSTSVAPDDPDYLDGSLWGMYGPSPASPTNAFGSQSSTAWGSGNIGSRAIYVGIIDTGITWTHPDLEGNVGNPLEIANNGADDDGNGVVDDRYGYDFVSSSFRSSGDPSPEDGNGHGTHVAGTIGAVGGNASGVVGVNWRVRMLSGKFLSASGSGSLSDAVKAIDYFTNLKATTGLNIVATNNSWGGGGFSQGLLDAINRGGDQGILFVAAAGNDGWNNDAGTTYNYPSNYRCVKSPRTWDCLIAVSALSSTGGLASWSNYGSTSVDLGAPGVGIRSTWNTGGYNTISGTSMATPHVTGAIALCASMGLVSPGDRRSAVIGAAQSTPTTSLSGKTVTGGRLNVAGIVSACGGLTTGILSTYQLSVALSGAGSGSVTEGGITCSTGSASGCQVTTKGNVWLSAEPATGSVFRSWTGCQSSSGPSCLVSMTQARSVTATFGLATYSAKLTVSKPKGTNPTVTVSASGGSAWTATNPCSATCTSSSLLYGTQLTFVANVATGASTVTWSGCTPVVGAVLPTCTVTVSGGVNVTARFTK